MMADIHFVTAMDRVQWAIDITDTLPLVPVMATLIGTSEQHIQDALRIIEIRGYTFDVDGDAIQVTRPKQATPKGDPER